MWETLTDYTGEAGVVIGTVAISHQESSLWVQTSGVISGVANEAEICGGKRNILLLGNSLL